MSQKTRTFSYLPEVIYGYLLLITLDLNALGISQSIIRTFSLLSITEAQTQHNLMDLWQLTLRIKITFGAKGMNTNWCVYIECINKLDHAMTFSIQLNNQLVFRQVKSNFFETSKDYFSINSDGLNVFESNTTSLMIS